MRLTMGAVLGVVSLGCGELVAASTPEVVLKPSTKWVMNYAPDSCELARQFGEGDQAVLARFIRYRPDDILRLQLMGNALRDAGAAVKVRFGDTGDFTPTSVLFGRAEFGGKNVPAILFPSHLGNGGSPEAIRARGKLPKEIRRAWPIVTPAQEAAATSVTIGMRFRSMTLKLGSMAEPMAAMRSCTDDLVRSWGLDPAEQAALAKYPAALGSPAKWLTSDDYPKDALRAKEQAMVYVRLMVDAAGAVTGCSVQTAIAQSPSFAEQSCATIKQRARFTPAQTRDGRAVPSYYTTAVLWMVW